MAYVPAPMDADRRPGHTCLVWATKGLMERRLKGPAKIRGEEPDKVGEENGPYVGNVMEDADTGLRSWFYAKRTEFGPNGWDRLVGEVDIRTVDGDHFSIVRPPLVSGSTFFFLFPSRLHFHLYFYSRTDNFFFIISV